MSFDLIKSLTGPALVAIGALLWATDTLFRLPVVHNLHPVVIVLVEHGIALLALSPFAAIKGRQFFKLNWKQFTAAFIIGAGGSALATVLFTSSFKYVNPSVSILLQKLQPVLTVLFAFLFLKERPQGHFYFWALVALLSGTVISFPHLDFSFLTGGIDFHATGVLYAVSAAAIWSLSTVIGKILLQSVSPVVATFWRFAFGFGTLLALVFLSDLPIQWELLSDAEVLKSLAYMSIIPGLFAIYIYYSGLKKTKATIATFVELVFPVSAVAINTLFLDQPLTPNQVFAGAVLLLSVTAISIKNRSTQMNG